tara:strand:+ start:1934 stop:2209 length:276 start_codon:yes stop_codon:yes gene_type:complete
MPIYEYKCKVNTCATDTYELIQGFNDKPGPCPDCNKKGEKLISAFSVHFKGSGWYSTSNRNSGSSAAKKDKAVSDKKTSKKDTKSKPKKNK